MPGHTILGAGFRYGLKSVGLAGPGDFRSTPLNGHSRDRRACVKRANNGHLSIDCFKVGSALLSGLGSSIATAGNDPSAGVFVGNKTS
jgi:hypothetical protein